MEATQTTIADVKDFLLRIQQGVFEPDAYLETWMPPGVCRYFLEHAVEIVPKAIRWGIGKPCQCHTNALTYASTHPGAIPMFGFQWLHLCDGDAWSECSWEVHSWVVESDGSIVDSGQYVPEAVQYIGVGWS